MKMTEDEKRELVDSAKRAPKSRWAYLVFAWPLITFLLGIVAYSALYIWLRCHSVEVWLHRDGHMERAFDCALARRFILAASLLLVAGFGFLTLLANIAYRQARLLRKAAKDMGLID